MNRILINSAAAINIAAAALIYIACSGDDGKDGSVCTGVQTASGVNIVCDGQTVGTVNNGQDAPGAAGTCTVLPPGADGSLNANCGGQTYPLGGAGGGGCTIADGDAYYILTCGTTPMQIAKAWCGSTPYNPSKQVCDTDGNISDQKCGIHVINTDIHFCANGQKIPKCGATFTQQVNAAQPTGFDTTAAVGGVEYDLATQFCGYGITKTITGEVTTISWVAGSKPDSVYTRCGTENVPNITVINPAVNHPKGIGWFNPSKDFCLVGGATPEVNTLCRTGLGGTGGSMYGTGNVCDYTNGKVMSVCGPNNANIYDTSVDFCQGTGANAKKLPLCGTEKLKYNADEFCSAVDSKVYPRCGDEAAAGNCGSGGIPTCDAIQGTCLGGSASGDVCSTTADCNQNTNTGETCQNIAGTCSSNATNSGATCTNASQCNASTGACIDGEFNPNTHFCATVNRVKNPPAPTSALYPTIKALCGIKTYVYEQEFCKSSEAYNRCGPRVAGTSGGTDVADDDGDYDKSHYDVTRSYCPQGATIPTAYAICQNATTPVLVPGIPGSGTGNGYNPENRICDIREAAASADGKTYKFIKVGNTQWLAENLVYNGTERVALGGATVGKIYHSATSETKTANKGYGLLYSTTDISLTGTNAICPEGWRIPNDTDWEALSTAAGGLAAALKSADATPSGVLAGNTWTVKGTDALGFNAWPAGKGVYTPDYEIPSVGGSPTPADGWDSSDEILYTQQKTHTYWWSSSPGSTLNLAKYRSIAFNDVFLLSGESNASTSFYSVRCVK